MNSPAVTVLYSVLFPIWFYVSKLKVLQDWVQVIATFHFHKMRIGFSCTPCICSHLDAQQGDKFGNDIWCNAYENNIIDSFSAERYGFYRCCNVIMCLPVKMAFWKKKKKNVSANPRFVFLESDVIMLCTHASNSNSRSSSLKQFFGQVIKQFFG